MPQTLTDFPEPLLGDPSGSPSALIREIESWIAGLPLANVDETHHLVVAALTKINDADLPPQDHFKMLELFRRSTQYLSDALKHHLLGASFPLTLKSRKVVAQLCDLHLAMAKGYQEIINELLGLNSHRQDFALLATCLHRALFYLGQELLAAYQVYEAGTPGRWHTIHRLYDAAERKGVQLSAVKDPYRQVKQDTTIEEQYKQILLLALANPFRHSPPDIALIYRLLEQWVPQCRIHSSDHFDESPHIGVVDLEGDEPPVHLAYRAIPQHTAYRILDVGDLVNSLENLVSQSLAESPEELLSPRGPRTPRLGKQLLQSLITTWRAAPGRRFSRSQRDLDEVEVSFGLNANHHMLGKHISMANNHSSAGIRLPFARKDTFPAKSEGDVLRYFCAVVNESAGGSCLKWSGDGGGKIRVGELIAFRHIHQPGNAWSLAVIRWLKNGNNHAVEFGIQLLSPDAMPISLRLENAKGAEVEHDYLKGFYLPELKATRQPASLIVPSLLYRVNDVVTLMMNHQEHNLRLTRATDSTPIFSRFQFVPLAITQNRTVVSSNIAPTKQVDSSLRSNL